MYALPHILVSSSSEGKGNEQWQPVVYSQKIKKMVIQSKEGNNSQEECDRVKIYIHMMVFQSYTGNFLWSGCPDFWNPDVIDTPE